MPALRHRIRALAVGIGAFALVAVAAGGTFAASNPATLYACYDVYGNVKMSDTAQCKLAGGGRLVSWSTVGVPGPTGPQGATGATGPTGPAGPGTVLTAIVDASGALFVSSLPPGATLNVTRGGPGAYVITVTGLGTGWCPLPTFTVVGPPPTFMWLLSAACGAGTISANVATNDGADHLFLLTVTGTTADAGGAGIQSLQTTVGTQSTSIP